MGEKISTQKIVNNVEAVTWPKILPPIFRHFGMDTILDGSLVENVNVKM
jgi:hypothetical protein